MERKACAFTVTQLAGFPHHWHWPCFVSNVQTLLHLLQNPVITLTPFPKASAQVWPIQLLRCETEAIYYKY
jgi:hypothetical protein